MTLIFVILTFIVVILTLILLLLITVLESDESLEIFAPYVGQVLDLRYHAKKGTRVGIGFNRSEKIIGFPGVLVLEVAFGIKDHEFGYAFTIACILTSLERSLAIIASLSPSSTQLDTSFS